MIHTPKGRIIETLDRLKVYYSVYWTKDKLVRAFLEHLKNMCRKATSQTEYMIFVPDLNSRGRDLNGCSQL